MSNIKLYRHPLSGHSHRVEVFLSLLDVDYELVDVDLKNGEHKQPQFLQKNIFGQVPVLEDGDITLSDSNAILLYLANKYDKNKTWYSDDIVVAAEIQRFLSVAAGRVAFGPAAARLINVFGAGLDADFAITTSHALFAVLEQHLEGRDWLVSDHPTIADVANYTYIAHAPEGSVSLDDYSNIKNWLHRFEQLPGFVPMQSTPVGLCA